jgi:hypothetical protein
MNVKNVDLKSYGQQLIVNNPEIQLKRYEGNIGDYHGFKVTLLECLIDEYKKFLFSDFDYCLNNHSIKCGENLSWHTDINLSNNYVVEPKYSLIIFESEYNEDFTGGNFEFVNETIIPQYGKFIVFDSREVYKINDVFSGMNNYILIRFY